MCPSRNGLYCVQGCYPLPHKTKSLLTVRLAVDGSLRFLGAVSMETWQLFACVVTHHVAGSQAALPHEDRAVSTPSTFLRGLLQWVDVAAALSTVVDDLLGVLLELLFLNG